LMLDSLASGEMHRAVLGFIAVMAVGLPLVLWWIGRL
jgi:hypothetical protein